MSTPQITLQRAIDLTLDARSDTVLAHRSSIDNPSATTVTLWIALRGAVDAFNGMVVNVSTLKGLVTDALRIAPVPVSSRRGVMIWLGDVFARAVPGGTTVTSIRWPLDAHSELLLHYGDMTMDMTFRYELAAAHRLQVDAWDTQKNQAVFGKCANPNGHGHNYTIDITVSGDPDRITGRLADPAAVDRIVEQTIIEPFDHKNLNSDTTAFADRPATMENMCVVFWDLLAPALSPMQLSKITIWETPRTSATYRR